MQLLEDNSRLPRSIRGDFQAQMAACRTGERRLIEVYTRFGKQVVEEAVEKIFAQCERQDRDAVAALPDGTWAAEGYLDNDGHGAEPVPVRLTVRIDGSDVYMDLAGSAPQTSGCLNCGFPQTVSAAKLAFKFLINPDVPASGGTVGYGLVPDSGGAGHRRGGLAVFRDYEFLDDTTHVSLWFERKVTPPWGLFGGLAGQTPSIELNRPGKESLHALKCSHVTTGSGSCLRAVTGGGGGYGPPLERERDRVEADLADGYISQAAGSE